MKVINVSFHFIFEGGQAGRTSQAVRSLEQLVLLLHPDTNHHAPPQNLHEKLLDDSEEKYQERSSKDLTGTHKYTKIIRLDLLEHRVL